MKRYILANPDKQERALNFYYRHDNAEQDAYNLCKVFDDNGVQYVVYNDFGWFEFVVRRSGKRWNDIMKLVNSVHPAKYDYTNTYFDYNEDGELEEVILEGLDVRP